MAVAKSYHTVKLKGTEYQGDTDDTELWFLFRLAVRGVTSATVSGDFCCCGSFKIYDLKVFLCGCVATQTGKFSERICTKWSEK